MFIIVWDMRRSIKWVSMCVFSVLLNAQLCRNVQNIIWMLFCQNTTLIMWIYPVCTFLSVRYCIYSIYTVMDELQISEMQTDEFMWKLFVFVFKVLCDPCNVVSAPYCTALWCLLYLTCTDYPTFQYITVLYVWHETSLCF